LETGVAEPGADLAFLIERWPILAADVKARIVALASGDD
jgi:hypothetical protein